MATAQSFIINLMGDVMLGRLIDQLFPIHVECPDEAQLIKTLRARYPQLEGYDPESPWGNAISLIRSGHLNIINLETSVTTHDEKWPEKVFNYRMHPVNIAALEAANIDYVSLANNHTLDFGQIGLLDTIRSLGHLEFAKSTSFAEGGISFAGAGETTESAKAPASLLLPRDRSGTDGDETFPKQHLVHIYSFSDHPREWASVPEFNLIDYSPQARQRMKELLVGGQTHDKAQPDLKILSIHWGPNYRWSPSAEIKSLAHFFIDECDVDLVHGHSSHHIQGVEIYKEKLIIYGCGDFVDDYAVVPEFRNDLSALWRVTVEEEDAKLKVSRLEVFPNRIKHFQAGLLDRSDYDHKWLTNKFRELCSEMGTTVHDQTGPDGQLVVRIYGS